MRSKKTFIRKYNKDSLWSKDPSNAIVSMVCNRNRLCFISLKTLKKYPEAGIDRIKQGWHFRSRFPHEKLAKYVWEALLPVVTQL